jgi:hypothetical protein
VVRSRLATSQLRQHNLIRWLWFVAAYLFVIVAVLWLAGIIDAPTSPDFGWSD